MKYKIKCKKDSEYNTMKSHFDMIGISYKQKDGKSLKVDCNKNDLLYYLHILNIHPESVKLCKNQKEKRSITGHYSHNNLDGFGLQEDYDLIKDVDRFLPIGGIHSSDDIKEYEAIMRFIDPSGMTRAIYEHSKRGFRTDEDYDEYDY